MNGHQRLSRAVRSAALAAVVFAHLSCNSSRPQSAAAGGGPVTRGGDLMVSVRTEPRSFCRYLSPDATTYLVSLLTQAALVRVNPANGEIEPWLAESWTRSDDGLRYVLKLRPGVQFSDGTPLTAEDVVFSLAAAYDPASAIADSLQVLGKRLQMVATEATTVTVTFPGAFGPGLRVLADLPILPRHRLKDALASGRFGNVWTVASPVTDVVGLGPFVITEYRPGERLVFSRNARYFRVDQNGTRLPYLDRVVAEIVPDQDAQVLKLQAGQTDTEASEIRPEDYAPVKRAADQGVLQLLDLGLAVDPDGLWINLRPGAFDRDPRRAWIQRDELRQAISYAVDRQRFADSVYLGAATPVFGPVTPSNRKWYSDEVPRPAHDLARAKQLLTEIGLVDRNGDGLVEDAAGNAARWTLLTAKGQTSLERGAAIIKEDLRQIGLTVDLAALDGNALIETFISGKAYDAVYFHLTSTAMDPALNADFWLSSGDAHVWNPAQKTAGSDWERQIDELMARNATALDDADRRAAFIAVQKIFVAHQPIIYFAAPRVFVAASRRMRNLTPAISRPQLLWAADTIAVTQ